MRRIYTREAPRKRGFGNGGIEGGGRMYVVLCAVLVLLVGTQARAAALSNEVHRAPGPPVVVQDDSFTFPTTPVGQTSTECRGVCFCNAANCMCENSGTIAIDKDLASPFSAYEYSLQDWTTPANCDGGTPVQPPVFVPSGQRLNFKVSFSPTRPGTFNDSLALDSYILDVSGSTPSGSPNLVPYQPSGWSGSLVVSTTPGTQQDSSTITSSDTLYASWAVQNNGDLSTSVTFYSDLYLDGSFLQRWQSQPPVNPGDYRFIKDYAFGPLAPGTHTLELVPDETATVGPSDNYTKTFTVVASGAPVLVPYQPPGWSAPLVVSTAPGTQQESATITSSDTLYASWAVANVGSVPTSVLFYTELVLDGAVLQTWYDNPPVNANTYVALKDYQFGPLSVGTHSLQLVPDATQTVGPSDTYNLTLNVTPASCNQAGSRGQSASCGPPLRAVASSLNLNPSKTGLTDCTQVTGASLAPEGIQRVDLGPSGASFSFSVGEGFTLRAIHINADGSNGPAISSTISVVSQAPSSPPQLNSLLQSPPRPLFPETVLLTFSGEPHNFFTVHSGTATLSIATAQGTYSVTIQVASTGYHLGSSNRQDFQGNDLDGPILAFADARGIPPQLVKAVIQGESSFSETAYRYEPLAVDFAEVSTNWCATQMTCSAGNLATLSAYLPYVLNSTLPSGGIDLTAVDKHLRDKYYVTLNSNDEPLTAMLQPLPGNTARHINDNDQPITMENILFTNNTRKSVVPGGWYKSLNSGAVSAFLTERKRAKNPLQAFTAQTVVAASYGLMQVLYVTAVGYTYTTATGSGLPPEGLFDENTSLDLGTTTLVQKYTRKPAPLPLQFAHIADLANAWCRNLVRYNGGSTYGPNILALSNAYFPTN
jgi:hypothetical protein